VLATEINPRPTAHGLPLIIAGPLGDRLFWVNTNSGHFVSSRHNDGQLESPLR
jgi:hypothetical protein